MKRIFSIFLCAVVIAALFVVPFSASAEDDIDSIYGSWLINTNPQGNIYDDSGNDALDTIVKVNGTFCGKTIIAFRFQDNVNSYSGAVTTTGEAKFSSVGYSSIYFDSKWLSEYTERLLFISDTIAYNYSDEDVTSLLLQWLKVNATKLPDPECDGTCEVIVHDFDNDGVCDDCGQPFTMTLRDTSYNFNGYMLPNIPEAEFMTYGYAIIEQEGEDVYLHFSTVGTRAENNYIMYTGAGNRLTYKLVGDEWTNDRTYTVVANEVITNGDDILWSNHDIKDKDNQSIIVGDTNFPLPLWMETEKVTQGAIPNFQTITAGNLMTLTLCGVGLITLLVGLYLLLRTFKTYRR